MTRRMISELPPGAEERFAELRSEWIGIGLSTERCDRVRGEAAVRRAYECAGLPPPRFVVWLDSPLHGAIAYTTWLGQVYGQVGGQVYGQVSGQVRDQVRGQVGGQVYGQVYGQVDDQVDDQVRDQVRGQVGGQVYGQVYGQVRGQVRGQVGGQVYGQVGGQVHGQVSDQVGGQVHGQVYGQVYGQVSDQVRGQVYGQVDDQVGGQVYGQVHGQVHDQVDDQVRSQVGDQVHGQVSDQVGGQVHGQVGGQVYGQLYDQVDYQVNDQLYSQVHGQVGDQVHGQVSDQVGGQVSGQVHGQVYGQVGGQVSDQVRGQVYGQVGGQVSDQVGGQVSGQVRGQVAGRDWWRYVGGGDWANWAAWVQAHQHIGVTGLDIAEGRIEASRHTWWWWPLTDIAFVCDRPTSIVGEQVAPAGWGSHRLHNPNGPAVTWANGDALYSWHGLTVPQWVVEAPTLEQIAAEPNSEIRRAAIESLGWPNYRRHLTLVDDSGCEHTGALYDPPAGLYDDLGQSVRVLIVRNGTDAVDGTPLWYGQTVPADVHTAQQAQNWMAGVDGDLVLERRT